MTRREKVLSMTALALVSLVGGGLLIHLFLWQPISDLRGRIDTSRTQLNAKQAELLKEQKQIEGILKVNPRLSLWNKLSLSPADLLAIVSGCGVAGWTVAGGATFGQEWTRLDLDGDRRLWLQRRTPAESPAIVAAEDARWRIEYTRAASGWPQVIRLVQRAAGPVRTDAAFTVDAPEAMDGLPDGALDVEVPAGTRVVGVADLKRRRELTER